MAIDNCFASKRWTEPEDWMSIARGLGVGYVEASADTECDPLYTSPEYLKDWAGKVRDASQKTGVAVSQFFSGHGTYATLGLCHPDARIRRRMLFDWLRPMCQMAGSFGANLGFFAHGLSLATLESPERYREIMSYLQEALAQIAIWAAESGCSTAGVEQMYSPHQPPWTLDGAESLMRSVYAQAQKPFYIAVDVGHQTGQERFLRPTMETIRASLMAPRDRMDTEAPWLGSRQADDLYAQALAAPERTGLLLAQMQTAMDARPYCFSSPEDGSTAAWIERLGAYSPIIHLQQVTGTSSQHLGFTVENNALGQVQGRHVIEALRKAYQRPEAPGMPPRVDSIYLTLEIFAKTNDRPAEIIDRMRQSVAYWRQFIPIDGTRLDEVPTSSITA